MSSTNALTTVYSSSLAQAVRPQVNFANNYGYLQILNNNVTGDATTNSSLPAQDQYIYFPSLPSEITLARSADFESEANMVYPDGLPFYKSTTKLEIPISFSLHYSDEFCPAGSVTLLDIASKLEALIVPVTRPNFPSSSSKTVAQTTSQDGTSVDQNNQSASNSTSADVNAAQAATGTTGPAACRLNIISSGGPNAKGINCVGYIKDVKVVLKGPWLQVEQNGSGSPSAFNLPTSADYEFVFVHAPGYSPTALSKYNLGSQAYAPEIYSSLFNNFLTLTPSNTNYIGLTGSTFNINKLPSKG